MKRFPRLIFGLVLALSLSGGGLTSHGQSSNLKGTVMNAAGQPVAGATVESYVRGGTGNSVSSGEMEFKERVETDASGTFEMTLLPDQSLILARKAGLAPSWCMVYRRLGIQNDLMLVAPGALTGVVVDEADQPVGGAEVFVALASRTMEKDGRQSVSMLTGTLARELFSTRTAADGRFRIGGFPTNATASLAVRIPAKALRQTPQEQWSYDDLPFQSDDSDIRLVVEPAGTVEGKIVLKDNLQPAPQARLSLQPDAPGFFGMLGIEPSMSDSQGRFRIVNVPEGNYRLRATFGTNALPDWVAESVPLSAAAGETTADVQITATCGGVLEVAIRGEEDGQPQPQVTVAVYRDTYQGAGITGSNGLARLRVPPGDYQVIAQRQDSISANTRATVEAGQTHRVEIELAGVKRIKGMVRGPDGQPAVGVSLRIVGPFGSGDADAQTDADGRFDLEWMANRNSDMNFTPCLLIRDAERNLAVAQDIEEDAAPLELRLEPGLTIVGAAVCDGKPITNATAALVFWTGNSGMHLAGLTTSKGPGQFEISALPPDRRYGLQVSAPGYGQKLVNPVERASDALRIEVDFVELLPANLLLAGQVVDEDDQPVAGANVHLSGNGQPNGNVRTDRQGRFRFEQVCEGAVRLYASARNQNGSLSAEGGDTNVVIRLGETMNSYPGGTTRKLRGLITDPAGQPVAGAQLAVFPGGSSRGTKTGANGAFNLTWTVQDWQMQSGDPLLVVRELARNLAAAEFIEEAVTNLHLRLKPALTLRGRVLDSAGQPLTRAQVGVWIRSGNSYSDINPQPASVDAAGAFEIQALPHDQTYMVYARATGYGSVRQNLDPDDEVNPLQLEPFTLMLADQLISGQVLNDDDKPISGAQVNLSGDGQPDGHTTTDSTGRFSLKVCEGQLRLLAYSQSGGYANLEVEAGDTNIVIHLARSGSVTREAPRRLGLKGRALPDLTPLGLAPATMPTGQPILLCLLDAEQRPSRYMARKLAAQQETLKQKGLSVLLVQAAVVSLESMQTWTNSSPLPFPLGCVAEETDGTKWATGVDSLPWFILVDENRKVAAEDFPLDELDAKLNALK